MIRKPRPFLVYFVSWDGHGIVKAGSTQLKRWRLFTSRGARLRALYEVHTSTEMYALETCFLASLADSGIPAFDSAADAVPFLGDKGAGYMECYRLTEQCVKHVLESITEHVPASAVEHHQPSTCTDVTDGLTKTVVQLREITCVSNAHTQATLILPKFANRSPAYKATCR